MDENEKGNAPSSWREEMDSLRLPKSLADRLKSTPAELFTISGKPKILAKTTYFSPEEGGEPRNGEVIVYDYEEARDHFIIIDPTKKECHIKFEPRNSKGEIIKGVICVYGCSSLQGSKHRLYAGGSEFHNPEMKGVGYRLNWQMSMIVSPGEHLQVEFLGLENIDPDKSKLEMVVLRKKIDGAICEVR